MDLDEKTPYGVTERQRIWGDEVLSAIATFSAPVKRELHSLVEAYLKKHAGRVATSTSYEIMDHVPKSRNGPFVISFLENELAKSLATLSRPSTDPDGHKHEAKLAGKHDRDVRAKVLALLKNPGVGSGMLSPAVALNTLLKFDTKHFKNAGDIVGEYFGYRRSATEGNIIRFHISIEPTDHPSIVTFTNHFMRGDTWITRGFGLHVDGISYLVGHAVSPGGRGLGLRCFALVRYPHLDWLTGPVLTVYQAATLPIAARVALIPEAYHVGINPRSDDRRSESILEIIKKPVTVTSFNQQIQQFHDGTKQSIFTDRRRASDYLQLLIRNWTPTTIGAERRDLPAEESRNIAPGESHVEALRSIWDLECKLANIIVNSDTVDGRYLRVLNQALKEIMRDTSRDN